MAFERILAPPDEVLLREAAVTDFSDGYIAIHMGDPSHYSTLVYTYGRYKRVMELHPFYYKLFTPLPSPTSRVQVTEIAGKGKGLIAKRSFRFNEPIVWERPLLVMMSTFPGHLMADFDGEIVEKMHPIARAGLKALHNCKTKEQEANEMRGKVRTNAFGIDGLVDPDLGDFKSRHQGVYPLASRANHSCEHNAVCAFSQDLFCSVIAAYRDIAAGEEITLPYGDVDASYAERQAHLKRKYAFDCKCPKCLRDEADIAELHLD